MTRIALLEDHQRMALLVERALAGAGISVDTFACIETAWHALAEGAYAVLVVDRGLPDGDGLDLVRRLRARGDTTPCLMVTARDALHDRVGGLEAGADDYLPKPFSMEELVARVRALMRRPRKLESLQPGFAGLRLRPEASSMDHLDESTALAPAELQIMLCLVKAGGEVVRRSRLESAGWGLAEAVTANALDVALHRLRKKLASIGSGVEIINLRGRGYVLRAGREAA